jgi:hypothetical protein
MKRFAIWQLATALAILAGTASLADAAIRIVRTGTTYSTVQEAVNAATTGDTIEIDSGTYYQSAGWATVNKSNLTIRGVGATKPILDAGNSSLSGKAIFVVTASGLTVENLEFKNCKCTSKNGAGIRQEAANLTVRSCYFHDNENGILANAVTGSTILIEYTEFNHNGYGDGQSHNLYINGVDQLTFRYNWTHNAYVGHELKTRAKVNYILYNRIGNEGGNGSYEVNVCNGGTTYIIGNQIEQSSTGGNGTIIDYASEGATNPDQHLYVVNNTIVNSRGGTVYFVRNYSTTSALLQNNIFQGSGTVLNGPGTQTTNWATSNAYLQSPSTYDYHLTASSTGAINAGTTPGTGINGFNMNPTLNYHHLCAYGNRPVSGTIDIGAYEYYVNQAPVVDAGVNRTINWPTNNVSLDATVTDDGQPSPPNTVTTTWSKYSGPGTVTFGNASAVDTTATFSTFGIYVLRLEASDSALSASDTVTIQVNVAPTVDAGNNQTITLPASASLSGSASDDGLPNPPAAMTYTWSKSTGPGTVTFTYPNSLNTSASFSAAGTYVLQLLANDSSAQTTDTVTITVNAGTTDITLQNGVAPTTGYAGCKDSYITAAAPTTNYGGNSRMSVTGYADQGATNVQRGILRFDLSVIPTGKTITNATLYLYAYDANAVRGSTGYYGVYPLTRSFTDTQTTWNIAATGVNWTTPGGDFSGTADGTAPKQAVAGVWYAFSVTSRVAAWYANSSSNYGWILKCTDENLHNQDNFYQSSTGSTTLRPKLVVTYQ